MQSRFKDYEIFNSIPFKKGVELFEKIQNNGALIFGAAGEMGSKISSTFPIASCKITQQDIDEQKLEESKRNAISTIEKGVSKRKIPQRAWIKINKEKLFGETIAFPEKGKIPFSDIDSAYAKLPEEAKKITSSFLDLVLGKDSEIRKDYSNAMMLLEAGPETLSFKQNIFRFFELALFSKEAILATNTSSLLVDEIALKVAYPERVVGFHYFLPADRNPLIEIIAGSKTSPEVLQAMQNLAISMGKKPIICWKDSTGAIANRILVGVLNQAAKLADKGIPITVIDKVFLNTLYSEQIKVQTKSAKRQFEAAPKLAFFKDEKGLYKKIESCDIEKKKMLIEEAQGKLRQKVLYAQIVENLERLGTFFTPASCVKVIKERAQEQLKAINEYLALIEKNPTYINESFPKIKPYDFPKSEKITHYSEEGIADIFRASYISIAQEIFKEGLATAQDIELACKEGFKYNIGPLELAKKLGKEKVIELTTLINEELDQSRPIGISRPGEYLELGTNDLSGIQTYIQDNIGFINMGRLHIQNLVMMQNSLGPDMLVGIQVALKDLQKKGVKVIIFRSQGGGAFSSGADLNYIASTNWDTEKILAFRNLGKKVMDEIANCTLPTVAIVDGPAVGGGLELALACDYRIFTDLAVVAMPEVGLGIIPDWGGTERLPAIIGKKLAKALICTAKLKNLGLKLGAEDSYKTNLADVLVTQSELTHLISTLIDNKGSNKSSINIYTKPPKKTNHERKIEEYPSHIVSRFRLNKPFRHTWRWTTHHAAHFAEDLIEHSDDLSYAKKVDDDEAFKKLIKSGKKVSNSISAMLAIVQNKILAGIFEKFGLLK
ncbi:MAG: enoyl-CoA hydratase/isomerase family protein [Candidatus Melainabacteria bacterium]|nr:enoyl-CoA hydratase/isomerase family protein [Candidatus Melainabacteria bacterium]